MLRFTWILGMSCRNFKLTDWRASRGHSWNQSRVVQFSRAGKRRARRCKLLPTGDMQSTTYTHIQYAHTVDTDTNQMCNIYIYILKYNQWCETLSCCRTRFIKKLQQFSLLSSRPSSRTSLLTAFLTPSTSSSLNRSGISPGVRPPINTLISLKPVMCIYVFTQLYTEQVTFRYKPMLDTS